MFNIAQRGEIEYLQAGGLSDQDYLTHAFCTRRGGVSEGPFSSLNASGRVGDREENFRQNLALIRETFAIPAGGLVLMNQIHGDRIRTLDGEGPLPGEMPECDGLITGRTGVALGVRSADCLPLLFVDRVRLVIGVAHAGWRGTALGMAAKMIDALAGRFCSRSGDILVAIGPGIGPCCYQVDAPVFAAMSPHEHAGPSLRPCREEGRWMLDLALANRFQLMEQGVPSENIFSADLCTACRPDLFFSHRASGGQAGRQLNILMLKRGGIKKCLTAGI